MNADKKTRSEEKESNLNLAFCPNRVFICVYRAAENSGSFDHDGVFELSVRKGFENTLLGELLDVETVRPTPENHTVAGFGDFDYQILYSAIRAGDHALCNDFDQRHGKYAHSTRCPSALLTSRALLPDY